MEMGAYFNFCFIRELDREEGGTTERKGLIELLRYIKK